MTPGMITQRVACKAIIVRDGKILLMGESSAHAADNAKAGRYQFPGGRIEPGEPFHEGLLREILEETKLKITVGKPFFIGEWMPVIKGTKNHIVAIFFECISFSGEVILSDEHDTYKWVGIDDVDSVDIMVPDDAVARKYFASQTI